jgi:hypothetical protein
MHRARWRRCAIAAHVVLLLATHAACETVCDNDVHGSSLCDGSFIGRHVNLSRPVLGTLPTALARLTQLRRLDVGKPPDTDEMIAQSSSGYDCHLSDRVRAAHVARAH